jgi:catechol 2,3-dioxygenase-like lactoylglutathione lyase family enzyme
MRLQLALNVTDLDEAIDFYSKMFGAEPAKTKPGYANFAGDHPEAAAPGEFHHLNHLGVETETADEVVAADARITGAGITTTGVEDAVCCYAEKTETWVQSPEGARWEWYVKSGDTDQMEHAAVGTSGVCCG